MPRRAAGITLLAIGGMLCSFAGARYALGAIAQDEARRAWDEKAARSAVDAARAASVRDPGRGQLPEGAPVARLVIPRIGLDEIVLEGVNDDALNGGPGHYPGSPLPGETGNAVISAHRDRHFRRLGELAVGDTIRTQSGSTTAAWIIVAKRVIDKNTPALFPSSGPRLTLTTCWPIRYLGTAPERLILTAKPVKREKS